MTKKLRIFSSLLALLFLSFSLLSLHVSAASIGQQLTQEESGWRRYDDADPLFTYTGNWRMGVNTNYYNKYGRYTNDLVSTVQFDFVGTKLRLISYTYSDQSPKIAITIDGVKETFAQYRNEPSKVMILVYEKTGLTEGKHTVSIQNESTAGTFNFDAVDIDSTGYITKSQMNSPSLSASTGPSSISLNWSNVSNANSYAIKRAVTAGGPYETIATGLTGTTYTDLNVTQGNTYYYVVTALGAIGESEPSNEVSASANAETGRAILTIALDNGQEKEYDLSMAEVAAFITWYEAKAAGTGTASFAIDKHSNNKGPFKSRKEYIIFNKIVSFEVNEYDEVTP
ncbi:fibronectin type III domain-containing protein [Gorillibacterium sp. CAU 1737]|uniref:fibronectin type III domain-containing protein n=1 Tax=Gorillibacterium sp. CAU 1737 TaxID=3140362 RepID=UPI003260CCF7